MTFSSFIMRAMGPVSFSWKTPRMRTAMAYCFPMRIYCPFLSCSEFLTGVGFSYLFRSCMKLPQLRYWPQPWVYIDTLSVFGKNEYFRCPIAVNGREVIRVEYTERHTYIARSEVRLVKRAYAYSICHLLG